MKEIIKKIYKKILPGYEEELLKELIGLNSVLDFGCGKNSPLRLLKNAYKVGVDVFEKDILESKKKNIHDKYYLANVLDADKLFKSKSFDCVVALDLIEHLTKKDGVRLIKKMEKISRKKVIIFTPNIFYSQEDSKNQHQEHKSVWNVKEFEALGYKVKGINGLKNLRKEQSKIKFKPHYLWLVISDITQMFVKEKPELAHQLLCTQSF